MSHFSYRCKWNDLYTFIYYENTKFLRTVSTKSQCTTLQSCYYFLYKNIVRHLAVLLLTLYQVKMHHPAVLFSILYKVTVHHLAVLLLYPVPSHNAPSCSPVTLSCTKNTAAHKLKLAQCLLHLVQRQWAVSQDINCSHIRHLIWVTRSARIFTFTDANLDRTNWHKSGINGLGTGPTDASISTACALSMV
jgi:hypothetical protein